MYRNLQPVTRFSTTFHGNDKLGTYFKHIGLPYVAINLL